VNVAIHDWANMFAKLWHMILAQPAQLLIVECIVRLVRGDVQALKSPATNGGFIFLSFLDPFARLA